MAEATNDDNTNNTESADSVARYGRPLKFQTPEELDAKIDAYFSKCENGKELPTITGLAVYLDTSRETLREYKERPGFVYSIKRALDKCEAAIEGRALQGGLNATFSIFVLKNNYGWKDKTESEVDLTSKGQSLAQPNDELRTDFAEFLKTRK